MIRLDIKFHDSLRVPSKQVTIVHRCSTIIGKNESLFAKMAVKGKKYQGSSITQTAFHTRAVNHDGVVAGSRFVRPNTFNRLWRRGHVRKERERSREQRAGRKRGRMRDVLASLTREYLSDSILLGQKNGFQGWQEGGRRIRVFLASKNFNNHSYFYYLA